MTTRQQTQWLAGLIAWAMAARSMQRVSDWCQENVVFNEPNCRGPFSFAGREYLREPLDWYQSADSDMVLCFGTRCGKTRVFFGGKAWLLVHEPTRMLCVMPNTHGTGGAQNVSRTRFQPMLRSTPPLASLIASGGQLRHNFKTFQQILGGSIIDWAGSNSPANLASNPARYVEQDEVDKYKRLGDREADPSKLADERCKEFSNPKRAKASTPTLVSGLIWQELMKTDLRRRFMPCPHCGKFVVFAWSREFTLLPKTGAEAYVRWDAAARRKTGDWDLDRVMRSARAECPYCQGHILDNHKTRMDRAGEWRPTQEGAPGRRGYHLPAMYSASRQTGFGQMAVRFLTAKRSIQGLQGFINSDLAEPYQNQDSSGQRVQLISKAIDVSGEWTKLMWVDCQARAPYFWYVVRAWRGLESQGVAAGSCDTWEEIRAIQLHHGVSDCGVFMDSGWGSRSEAEVYRVCARYSKIVEVNGKAVCVGWIPAKGMPGTKRWKDPETGVYVPWFIRATDPFEGTREGGRVSINLFEASSDFYKDILANMRAGRAGAKWSCAENMVAPVTIDGQQVGGTEFETYWRHLDGQHKVGRPNKFNGRVVVRWEQRHSTWPDHLFMCETGQVAAASFHRKFPLEYEGEHNKKV